MIDINIEKTNSFHLQNHIFLFPFEITMLRHQLWFPTTAPGSISATHKNQSHHHPKFKICVLFLLVSILFEGAPLQDSKRLK